MPKSQKNKSLKKESKTDKILKIVGLLEEKGKTKDWIIEEIKKHRIGLRVSPTANNIELLKSCPSDFIDHLLHFLRDDEFHIQEVKELTKTLHWFFIDIVGSSNPTIPTKAQIRKISTLNSYIQHSQTFTNRDHKTTIILPTGDGMAIGFFDSPEQPLRLAIEIHKELDKYNRSQREKDKIQIRIGMDTGPVYFIKDVEGNNAVWGPGVIFARRVMDLCGPNQIFASTRIGDDIRNLTSGYKEIMHKIGIYKVKHGTELQLYNIYGKNFGNKSKPKTNDLKKSEFQSDKQLPDFEFNKVEIKLDVTDPKTMMTHHTILWDVKNNSKKPLTQIFYPIYGDTPKDFADMNVKITDEAKRELDIANLEINKPTEKAIIVNLNKPLKFRDKGRIIKLEYDWEEPERIYEYVFSTKCKKFKYVFTIPRGHNIKSRFLEVDKTLGQKYRVNPPTKIKQISNKTQVSWESDKKQTIERFATFEYQW